MIPLLRKFADFFSVFWDNKEIAPDSLRLVEGGFATPNILNHIRSHKLNISNYESAINAYVCTIPLFAARGM